MIYPFTTYQEQEGFHKFWVAKSNYLNGCLGQGDDIAEAIAELEENELSWLETAHELNFTIPEVPAASEREYSGRLSLRISEKTHRDAALNAKKEGVSLNQYINDAIVARNSGLSTIGLVMEDFAKYKVYAWSDAAGSSSETIESERK